MVNYQCCELEDLEEKGRSDLLYAKVRKLTGGKKGGTQCSVNQLMKVLEAAELP